MCIGSGCLSNVKNEIGTFETNVMKILGIYFGKNKKECETLNWKDKVQKIIQTLNLWRQRQLTNSSRESSCDQYITYVKIVVYIVCYNYA